MTVAEYIAQLRAGPVDARTAILIAELRDLPQDATITRRTTPSPGVIVTELTLRPAASLKRLRA